ncbi:hypothetical protein K469DRAFT_680056 [Zopfia rhizophila CBS 207.26]|uniref:Uncharacterized protein n=1 Tax=Zopfia rhizophila CBS 207.26 TaxID=1314779 RepID=A0A6A6DCR2_9PEZI|nr:hypothetical protein K469DRAFT_680056 [Zopfia rhizophila CBS 207.26]
MAAPGIPLHCNICPKKPNFSDVSHLLTHIASKGHLSHYYKVKVRSGSEDASRRLIEAYDQWYAEWNVEDLMSERMNQKDKRRTRARTTGTARTNPAPKVEAVAPRPTRPRAALSNLLDPRLSEQQLVKIETSVTPTPPPQTGPVLRHRPFAPRMQYWPSESRSTSRSYTNPDYDTSSEYSDPSERKRYRYTAEDSCAIEDDPADTTTEDIPTGSECTKLKGIYWPGMDLFDSATPEMRRKRNQKKDSSVVEQLELNSQEVEPTELIFTPQGSFKKQRRISGSVYDESSPIKLESPREYMTRPILTDVDVNAGRPTRQLPIRPPAFPYLSRDPYEGDRGRAEYGYGDQVHRRKRTFDVFQDDEIVFAQPAGFNYLTAAYHQPSPSPVPTFVPFKALNDSCPYENKENILPAYHQQHYEHHCPAGYHFPAAYPYGLGHDQHVFQYHNPLFNSAYQQNHQQEEADDQRTLTAPPSPSNG